MTQSDSVVPDQNGLSFALPARRQSEGIALRKTHSKRSSHVVEDVGDEKFVFTEDGPEIIDSDFKEKQVFKGWTLVWLAYQSIGVIYGDIGTSPLYVYSSTFTEAPDKRDLIEVLSVIIWSITFMVTIKYILIILYADNEGEGGTFSCYSLLTRYANISNRDPREASYVKLERYHTGDLSKHNHGVRSFLERSWVAKQILKVIGILAVSMVMADGVLTPAQSVLGAVQGLRVVKPGISDGTVVGATCGILVLLFAIQPFGTTRLASFFAPIVIVWLGFNAGFGIYNLVMFDHTVLKAFSPSFFFKFFIDGKQKAWHMLGGILLAFTGVEALFADLGFFSIGAIQLSWLLYAYPCLLLAYTGQAAYISVHPDAYSNPFFNAVPPGMLYPSLVVAVLAAIVASQAMITATFQLLSQMMKLSYFPQVKVVHTSEKFHGQLYIPFLNWILMIGTIIVTAVYSNTTRLGNAYGLCVIFVTFFDTCLVTLVALVVWRFNVFLVFLPWLIVACVDCLYLSSALKKVPDGAWFTLTLSAILTCLFVLWRFGKEHQWKAEAEDRFQPTHLIEKSANGQLQLTPRYGGEALTTMRAFGIFFDKAGVLTPTVFTQFVSKLISTPQVMVFLHLRPLEVPFVPKENRYTLSRFSIPGCYRFIIRHGYMDDAITPEIDQIIFRELKAFVARQAANKSSLRDAQAPENGMGNGEMSTQEHSTDAFIATELAKIEDAFNFNILYIVGKEQMKIKMGTNIWKRLFLWMFLWLRDNTRAKIASLPVSIARVIEVGFVKEV